MPIPNDLVRRDECKNERFVVYVHAYTFDQKRIQLIDKQLPDYGGHEGSIIREMCTYKDETMKNCEFKGGRIRLDNEPKDRPEMVKHE